jgi:N-dimethylarginine dimethylaminohydrolase
MVDAVRESVAAWGGQSMVAPLRRVLINTPTALADPRAWEAFGYPRPVDMAQTRREHDEFRALLAATGCEVIDAGSDDPTLQDAIFTFDPSIVTDAGAILCRMGKPLRRPEVARAEQAYARLGVPIIGRIEAPGTLEGGDCLWLDERTLVVGRGYRTNADGIIQLTRLLQPLGVAVIPVDLPYWHGPDECLHLLSLISLVDTRLAVVYLPLMAVAFVELLRERGFTLLEIPEEEYPSQGTNVLATAPRQCILLRENVGTARLLREAGCTVSLYAGDEISHNRAGGPTCLTRPLLRQT